ncbi:ABC-type transport system involved in resistance to organic solvents [Collimonas arenae]|uniref:ABC-type transport system involved in resistance to organic solvents n=1 Tax=Collimonas arenae TaxID=279058 RepID=A0A0A1FGV6_9BURK|nr:ABC transporter permease [Collimonas arenae]AIY42955.1 ABC-type transport system involved in resistance to organic solvents [Collimonas arenae]
MATATTAPRLERKLDPDGSSTIEVSGTWLLRAILPDVATLRPQLAQYAKDGSAKWDLRSVQQLDAAGALFLWRMWGRRRPEIILKPEYENMFDTLATKPVPAPPVVSRDWLEPLLELGQSLLSLSKNLYAITVLAGNLLLDCLYLLRHPADIPWREISANIHRTGSQALAITALVGFLVGVVLSYLSSIQLKNYGADVFIINILGLGIVRELGPILAAILVAGRSGSSMTAQLGVMRVTRELDALSAMGISHTQRLVLPKVLALAITLPLLIIWSDAAALVGGMLSAYLQLGIGYQQFLHGLPAAVPLANLWLGLCKGSVFGMLVALIACHYGLQIKPNTESLGASTTDSVVTSITIVIIVDAIFAVIFSNVGF